MRYLLAAEADKIQDFIFRSSRLREVVGASQLLTRFCRSVQDTLAPEYKGQIVVNDGGSFRVIFDTKPDAVAFGADLAELYRLALGGSLTVATPVALNGDFRKANDEAGKKLRWAKSRRLDAVVEPHMAYVAFCASCGIALANEHTRLAKEREGNHNRYLCSNCLSKASESATNRSDMLNEFLSDVIEDRSQLSSYEFLFEPEKIGNYDTRNYVAYLVADGNGMGMLFGSLQNELALHDFSEGLSSAVRKSLAVTTQRLRDQTGRLSTQDAWSVPVLPLILGGDDLFALIPAPYSLDFARRFCLAWEDQLRQLTEKVGLTIGQGENGGIPRPTVAAAVVICKSKYPYALAHRRAEALLKEAKRQSKLLAAETGEQLSAVNFEVIVGNRLAGLEDEEEQSATAVRSTLRPYWVTRDGLSVTAQGRGIDLEQLLAQRVKFKNTPNKRLAELRRCFEDLPTNLTDQKRRQEMENWTNHKLGRILGRLGKATRSDVEAALTALGKSRDEDTGKHHWRQVQRGGSSLLAHGMLDLLEAWDFAQDFEHGPAEYEPQEEEA